MKKVTFKVEKSDIHGDYRVNKYVDGTWVNARDCNWTKSKANQIAREYRKMTTKGIITMGDNI